MHYRAMFDTNYVGVWDLDGNDRIVTITKVEPGKVGGQQGRKAERKPIVHFKELDAPLVCNVTNARTIAGMYGTDVRAWAGKRVTLYPTTTTFGRETVDCIRVRPTPPKGPPTEGPRSRPINPDQRAAQNRAAGREQHPARPIADASTPAEMLAAIRDCARWIEEDSEPRWKWVAERCDEIGLEEVEADAALQEALESLAEAS